MDRIINVKVGGNYISKDSKNAGVRGEANVTKLRITFDEGWDGFTKTITFWNARGLNPVVIDLLPHLAESSLVYLVPIPAEPMEIAGELTFVIEGTVNDKVQRSFEDKLEVKDASIATNAGQPVPPTESELKQLSGEIEQIKGDILVARDAKEATEEYKEQAKTYASEAYEHSFNAQEHAKEAEGYASRAETSVGKASYIGDDGCWYAWDVSKSEFYNTGVKAQAGSTVYCGDNPPAEADVWIDPNGEAPQYITEAEAVEIIKDNVVRDFSDKMERSLPPSVDFMLRYIDGLPYGEDVQVLRQEVYDNYVANGELNHKIAQTENFINHDMRIFEVEEETKTFKTDVEGIQKQIHEEAHFRGYLSTNAKIQALNATPNDFAYSAESGTKWIYDAENGWQNSGTPVPDQLTPASVATPLMDGEATAGESEEYARGDHRHPTDTTRLSVAEFNAFKTDIETSLDNVIAKYGLGGDA